MIPIPDNIIMQLRMHCEANGLAMAQVGSDELEVTLLLLGSADMHPNDASIHAAHLLLNGVVTGALTNSNEVLKEEISNSNTKPN